MGIKRRIQIAGILLYVLTQILFLVNIQFPGGAVFDEFTYVPAAKALLATGRDPNFEHPPLGKALISISIALGGDRTFGWRWLGAVAGALTVLGTYAWGIVLFRSLGTALFAGVLAALGHYLYVQSRLATIDIFMLMFLTWGAACFSVIWNSEVESRRARRFLEMSFVCFGLALACKWAAIPIWLAGLFSLTFVLILRGQNRDSGVMSALPGLTYVFFVGLVVPLAVYGLCFLPLVWSGGIEGGILGVVEHHRNMLLIQLDRASVPHPYSSRWPTWPFLIRPLWYAFEPDTARKWFRGVFLVGNPAVTFLGLYAIAAALWSAIRRKARESQLISLFYWPTLIWWALVPRETQFYYYYLPCALVLPLAIAWKVEQIKERNQKRLLTYGIVFATLGFFVYFFPVLAALKVRVALLWHWTWFESWI